MTYEYYKKQVVAYKTIFNILTLVNLAFIVYTFRKLQIKNVENVNYVIDVRISMLILQNMSLYFINVGLDTNNLYMIKCYKNVLCYNTFLLLLTTFTYEAEKMPFSVFLLFAFISTNIFLFYYTNNVRSKCFVYMQYFDQPKPTLKISNLKKRLIRTKLMTVYKITLYFYMVKISQLYFIREKHTLFLIPDLCLYYVVSFYFTMCLSDDINFKTFIIKIIWYMQYIQVIIFFATPFLRQFRFALLPYLLNILSLFFVLIKLRNLLIEDKNFCIGGLDYDVMRIIN